MTTTTRPHRVGAASAPRTVAAPRLTAILDLVLAVGVLAQGAFAGAFMAHHHLWYAWHETLGNALILPPLVSLAAGLVLLRRHPDAPSAMATRIVLLTLVTVVIAAGHAGPELLLLHIPAGVAVVAIAVSQAAQLTRSRTH